MKKYNFSEGSEWISYFNCQQEALYRDNPKKTTSGLEKAMIQERIKKQETELRAYIEVIMSKWNESL